ncbi:hypothetical protein L210DRAFT_984573 [Boletus edulis BED1]|uniref:Uncharacterized protein n=1 Tax=Boletus edulis BED1 TaxID=1328754 RepID=A0AAD4BYU5_BOLED|nr:hypothetical protein L210DRAFT_984573 [Boletus edulis BED1]
MTLENIPSPTPSRTPYSIVSLLPSLSLDMDFLHRSNLMLWKNGTGYNQHVIERIPLLPDLSPHREWVLAIISSVNDPGVRTVDVEKDRAAINAANALVLEEHASMPWSIGYDPRNSNEHGYINPGNVMFHNNGAGSNQYYTLQDQRVIERRVPRPPQLSPPSESVPAITFSVNGYPGVRMKDIQKDRVTVDAPNDLVFEVYGFRSIVINLEELQQSNAFEDRCQSGWKMHTASTSRQRDLSAIAEPSPIYLEVK